MSSDRRMLESLEFVKRPLALNSSNGYRSCQNCGHGWFPEDGEQEDHDSRCPHVVLAELERGGEVQSEAERSTRPGPGNTAPLESPQETAELRCIGDLMQSSASRVLEYARERSDSNVRYETSMAMIELDDAINQWTDARIGYVAEGQRG